MLYAPNMIFNYINNSIFQIVKFDNFLGEALKQNHL